MEEAVTLLIFSIYSGTLAGIMLRILLKFFNVIKYIWRNSKGI